MTKEEWDKRHDPSRFYEGQLVHKSSGSFCEENVGVVLEVITNDVGTTILRVLINDKKEKPQVTCWFADYVVPVDD